MEETKLEVKRHSDGLFATLEGMPAHILIILGLALILVAPLILNFKGASLAGSQAEFDQIKKQKALDLEGFKRDQADQRKKSPEVIKFTEATEQRKPVSSDPSLSPQQIEAQQKREQEKDKAILELKKAVDEKDKEREKALEAKAEELERKYDTIPIRGQIAEVQTAVAGTRSHLVLGWLGGVLLLAGLLVMMLQSEGLRQKVILVVLLIVMFIALSGVDLDLAQRRMGGSSYTAPRVTERTSEARRIPEASSTTRERIISKVWQVENGVRFQFKSDGRFVVMPPQGIQSDNLNGTWLLAGDEKKIVVTLHDKSETTEITMEIIAVSEQELKLRINGREHSWKASAP